MFLDDTPATPRLVGMLRPSFQGGRTLASSSFQYDSGYLASPDAYALSPDLPLVAARQYTDESTVLFGALADATPDEWGQKIIRANHANRLREDASLPRRVGAFDFLIGVSDHTRTGALRLRHRGRTVWLSSDAAVATVHDLVHILAAAKRYESDDATAEDVAYLNGVATSPGGARPKANVVLPSGRLALAKLPRSADGSIDVEAWEAVALTLASSAGLRTSPWRLRPAGTGRSVLVVDRFDRGPAQRRIGYASAATMLEIGQHDDARVTYEEFTDTIAEVSADPRTDLLEMFGRIALTILINNVDDHWRNHGFLRESGGWRLAPVFDVNPSPHRGIIDARQISDVDDPRDRRLEHLLDIAAAFHLTRPAAVEVLKSVAGRVRDWRAVASDLGISHDQAALMAPAFDDEQIAFALSLEA